MSHLDEQEVLEMKESLLAADVTFEHYLRHIVVLDKATYNKIFDDTVTRNKFASASIEERLGYFSSEFKAEIELLYQNQLAFKKSSHALANNIYNLSRITGSTYKEIAEILEKAFSRQISKGQISKLFKAGELLNRVPELKVVQDVEKLATLSRIPSDRLSELVETSDEGIVRVANHDIGKVSRAQVQKIVEQEVPRVQTQRTISPLSPKIPIIQIDEAEPVIENSSLDLNSLKADLNGVLPYVQQCGLSDLSLAIVECIRIIESNLK